MPQVLVNPESGLAEAHDNPEQIQSLLSQGYEIPLHDAQGNAVSAPYSDAAQLVQSGQFRQPTSDELNQWLTQSAYQTPSQKAIAAAEGAGRGAFGPLATLAETKLLGVPPQDIEARQKLNPGVAVSSELGTMAGLTAMSFGLFGEARAGMAAATMPGLIAKAGEAGGAAVKATGVFGGFARAAVTGAIESGLYEAQNQVTEKILGSPDATGEHMIASIGLSAALGGGLGIALKPITAGISKALDLGAGFLGIATEPEAVSNDLRELKPNVDEIDEAGKLLGVQPLEMQRSNSRFVQDLQQSILKEAGTWSGLKLAQRVDNVYKGIGNAVNDALGQTTEMTKYQVGGELKNGLLSALSEEYRPINALYDAIKETGRTVPIAKEDLTSLAKDIFTIEGLTTEEGAPLSPSGAGYKLAERVSGEIGTQHLKTVNDLRLYMQRLSQDTLGQPELRYPAGQMNDKMQQLFEDSVVRQAENFPENPKFNQLLADYTNSKEIYSQFRGKLDELGSVLGKKLRKGEGMQAFEDFVNSSPNEKIADKLFTKNNADFLGFLKDNFPVQSELLSSMKRAQFRDLFEAKGISATIKEIGKLEPEILNFLFRPEDIQKLEAADTLLKAFPKEINPSGTAKTLRLIDLFRNIPGLAISEIASRAKKFLIESLVRNSPNEAPFISAMLGVHKIGTATLIGIEKSAAGLFGYGASKVFPQPSYSSSELNPQEEKIKGFQMKPELLVNHMGEHMGNMASYLPETSVGFSQTLANIVNHLSQVIPNTTKMAPLDLDKEPTKSDISKFNRTYDLLDNPLSLFSHIKQGSLNQEHMNTMQQVYPSVLKNIQKETMRNLSRFQSENPQKPIPYPMKLGLSTLFGQAMDSSLHYLSSNQAILSGISMASAAANGPPKVSKSGMSKMKMSMRDETKAQQALERARA